MTIYSIPETLSCIIFDIDSTLYTNDDYAREQVDIQLRHFAKLRNESFESARDTVEAFRNENLRLHNKRMSLGNALTHFGIPISESIKWRETLLEPAQFLVPDPELQETLRILSSRFTLIAVTNNPVLPARKTLDALGVSAFLPSLIGLDTTGVSKPHTRPFLVAAELARASITSCLSVGDRFDIDIALPLELGMGGILVDGVADVYLLPDLLFRESEREFQQEAGKKRSRENQ
jgi:phosphoglycolate phosphatase/putative hydrolase of the HAD superfamily